MKLLYSVLNFKAFLSVPLFSFRSIAAWDTLRGFVMLHFFILERVCFLVVKQFIYKPILFTRLVALCDLHTLVLVLVRFAM